ncbi:MAG TPA: peptidylprolyl isomerase [Fusobacteriaceae bacterium]|nr:peptidylprolyl isomerase [Fusobacteriaceae bacterium]
METNCKRRVLKMKIENGKKVTLEFVLRDKKGNLLDKTTKGDELKFTYGDEAIVIGLEEALLGKKVGDKFNVKISPNKGYGEYDENLTIEMPIEDFDGMGLYEGLEFEAETDNGIGVFTIKEVISEEDKVVVDGNHPYAGMTLNFEIKVLKVK